MNLFNQTTTPSEPRWPQGVVVERSETTLERLEAASHRLISSLLAPYALPPADVRQLLGIHVRPLPAALLSTDIQEMDVSPISATHSSCLVAPQLLDT